MPKSDADAVTITKSQNGIKSDQIQQIITMEDHQSENFSSRSGPFCKRIKFLQMILSIFEELK